MELIDKVIKQIKSDLSVSDETAIESLLTFVPKKNLLGFLSEDEIDNFKAEGIIKDRQDVIQELTDDAIETVFNADNNYDDREYIDSVFREGFKGFHNLSDDDLEKEYYECFDEEVIIFCENE